MKKYNVIIGSILLLLLCLFIITFIAKDIIISSSISCRGTEYNRTCIYSNIYYYKRKWYYFSDKNEIVRCVSVRSRNIYEYFKPIIVSNRMRYNSVIDGLSTYVSLFYTNNIGHLLFDDLYSIYLSFLKFNYKLDPFNIIISQEYSKWRNNRDSIIFEKFSRKKLIYESDMNNSIVLIRKLIVGIAHQCQRCVNKEYSIAGGIDYKATWWMRKRMYYVYNISTCENRYGIIVDNKRYTKREKYILKDIINKVKSEILLLYIDWRIYSFENQLKILSCTKLYISGPGTGLLNFPFISDPGVIINLGGLFRGCPFYMEQYIAEGSMHFVSLYYPSNKRRYGLQDDEIKSLINKAVYILNNWYSYKAYHITNLNVEGAFFKSICNRFPILMNKFINEIDWAKNKGYGIWAEKVIYFPYCYNLSYVANIVAQEVANYRSELGCKISSSHKLCLYNSD